MGYTNEQKADAIRTVIGFLEENQQYGDDWGYELDVLNAMLDEFV